MKSKVQTILLITIVLLLVILPLVFVSGDFSGADGKAEQAIVEIAPEYEPWFSLIGEIPGETESMLFALQAALGAGLIGYVIGLFKGRRDKYAVHD
ncbi:energy-coupling factor ABC transporter substrate-binding protein [Paenibacillus abyssi]|uniref:Cobalt transport protein CbiN n=1 Tax=Paenibacillus abyssi TaxID=1340531 RepID=A0A917CPF6_9BACL|nr:energy-coupling factor ABC transporter substrate-binding protein [Paenibacillus abyssi]GGF94323.1 cobalt transport protein CbiN [Paenibacillus abyssi]